MNNALKNILLIVFISFLALENSKGATLKNDSLRCEIYIDSISKIEYYLYVDSMPEYPGGMKELLKFFMANFNYPNEIDACCKVIVEFIIDQSGEMQNIRIYKGLQEDFDNETLRIMRIMPKWRPGTCNGKPVPVKLYIPFNITLQ